MELGSIFFKKKKVLVIPTTSTSSDTALHVQQNLYNNTYPDQTQEIITVAVMNNKNIYIYINKKVLTYLKFSFSIKTRINISGKK